MARTQTLMLPSTLRTALLLALLPAALTGLSACSGSDGADGKDGKNGIDAPVTNESCMVCHTTGRIADISDTNSTSGFHYVDADHATLAVSNLTLTNAGGFPQVSFNVKKNGANYTALTLAQLRLYLADLVPANTPTAQGTFASDYYELWASERDTTPGILLDSSDSASGNYKVTMATGFAAAVVTAPEYSRSHPQRLVVRLAGKSEADASITDNTVGILDFRVPTVGTTVTSADLKQYQKAYVTIAACQKCHGAKMENAAHAGNYLDTRACVVCHSPIGTTYGARMQADETQLSVFIHQIHASKYTNANTMPDDDGEYLVTQPITYPQDIKNCVVCHTDSGLDLSGTAARIANWQTHPTIEVCVSCHTTVNFATGENHGGGIQVNGSCSGCHPATGVASAHATTPASANVPEFDVNIAMTPATAGPDAPYSAGETPVVTVTLTNHATGLPFTNYTLKDARGVAGGGLSGADLYVYGPRAWALPVLTKGSATDTALAAGAIPTQSHSLLLPSSDTSVTADANGFHYQLQAIPAGMQGGTYTVRFEGSDYGALSETDYVTASVGLRNFQVGTADISPKVAGDACIDCHGDTRIHQTGATPHNVPFDTDQCNSCHDHSGNPADPIANRVHAIHSASVKGDLRGISWAGKTFSRDAKKCVACHTSGNTTYRTNVYEMPCYGCHADANQAIEHMRQNGGKL